MFHFIFWLYLWQILIDFDNFCIIGNRNEYSTKQIQIISLQLYYVSTSTLPDKTKIAQKQPTAYCSIQLNRLYQNFTESRSMYISFRIC